MTTERTLSGLPAADALSAEDLMLVGQGGLAMKTTVGAVISDIAGAVAFQTEASVDEASAGTSDNVVMTPRRVKAVTDAAVDALEAETAPLLAAKVPNTRTVTGAGLVSGGGDLSANRTFTVTEAGELEALAGVEATTVMTPRRTKAVVDASAAVLQSGLDDLAAAQASGSVVAGSWTELEAYPTGARAEGDYGKVVGADFGTHTDPVVGGTVNNRGGYRWSSSPVGWKRVADLDADDAAASAAAAAAAVEAVLPPTSYSNLGATGDRTSIITVTASDGFISEGTANNLVDGGTTFGPEESIAFAAVSVAGAYFRFDFGPSAAQRITEARWKQTGTATHGDWKWRASDDLETWTDIGSSFTLGGATEQLHTDLVGNTAGFRYYELVGVSGTLSNLPYVQEIEFKIAPTSFDQKHLVSPNGNPGEVLTKWSDLPGDYGFQPARRVYPMSAGVLAEWYFDEGEGDRVRNMRSGDGVYDVVFDSGFRTTFDSSPEWTRRGLLLQDDMVRTAATVPGVRTIATLYRVSYGASGQVLSAGNPAGGGVGEGLFASGVNTTFSYHVANGSGIAPLSYHTTGEAAVRLNRGGWLLVFTEFPAAYDTVIGWGGRSDNTAERVPEMELAWSVAFSGQLTADDREAVFLSVRRLACERGIYLHWRDCPEQIDCIRFLGQSGVTGYSLVSEITSADTRARTQPCDSVLVSHMASSGGEWLRTERFQFKYNHRIQGSVSENQGKMGPLPGAAFAHEDNRASHGRRLLICQSAQDSTSITINPTYYTDDRTWNAATAKTGGMLWASMRHWWTIEQNLLSQGIGPRLRACWYFQGEEDGQPFSLPENWQDDIQGVWDAEKLYMGAGDDYVMKLIKTGPLGELYGLANNMVPEKIAQVRAGQVAFAAANTDVELIDCDDLPLDSNEHWNGQSSLVMGERLYDATDLS